MSQEEFQKLVLEKFDNLENEINNLKKEVKEVKNEVQEVKNEVQEVKTIVLRTEEQTKQNTEFKQAVKDSASDLLKKIS